MKPFCLATVLFLALSLPTYGQEKEQFLIPIATDRVVGANGGHWGSRVRIFNYGDVPIGLGPDVPFSICDPGPTPRELPPLMGIALCSLGSEYPPARIFDVTADKKIALESHLITPARQSLPVPVVPLRDFRNELVFDGLPIKEGKRLALRLYHNEMGMVAVRVRIIEHGGRVASDQVVLVSASAPGRPGYLFIPLPRDVFSESPGAPTILAESDVPLWGLISSTDNETSEVELHTPAAATPVPSDQQCP